MGKTLKVKQLSINATIPSTNSVGYDLYSAYDYTIPPQSRLRIKTDISIELPSGCYGKITPISDMAIKNCVDVSPLIINQFYSGNVKILLINSHVTNPFTISKGDKIAILLLENVNLYEIEKCENEFESTPVDKPLRVVMYNDVPKCIQSYYLDEINRDEGTGYGRYFEFNLSNDQILIITISLYGDQWQQLAKYFIENENEKTYYQSTLTTYNSITILKNVVEFYTDEYRDCNYRIIVEKKNCRFLENIFSNSIEKE